jgi:hypothetical protein
MSLVNAFCYKLPFSSSVFILPDELASRKVLVGLLADLILGEIDIGIGLIVIYFALEPNFKVERVY